MNLALSTGLIIIRAAMGLVFAREFTREAFVAASKDATSDEATVKRAEDRDTTGTEAGA